MADSSCLYNYIKAPKLQNITLDYNINYTYFKAGDEADGDGVLSCLSDQLSYILLCMY